MSITLKCLWNHFVSVVILIPSGLATNMAAYQRFAMIRHTSIYSNLKRWYFVPHEQILPFMSSFYDQDTYLRDIQVSDWTLIWMIYRHDSSKEKLVFEKANLFTWRYHANFHVHLPTYAFWEGQTTRMNNSQSKLIIYVTVWLAP